MRKLAILRNLIQKKLEFWTLLRKVSLSKISSLGGSLACHRSESHVLMFWQRKLWTAQEKYISQKATFVYLKHMRIYRAVWPKLQIIQFVQFSKIPDDKVGLRFFLSKLRSFVRKSWLCPKMKFLRSIQQVMCCEKDAGSTFYPLRKTHSLTPKELFFSDVYIVWLKNRAKCFSCDHWKNKYRPVGNAIWMTAMFGSSWENGFASFKRLFLRTWQRQQEGSTNQSD